MSFPITLNEDEKDCLQELMNVSYGEATAAISSIIDKFATLTVPKISTVSSGELKDHLNKKLLEKNSFYIASQLIHGNISGENLFVIDETSAYNLSKEFGLEEDEIDQDEISEVILEITNILSSVTSGKLASMINANISFSAPNIAKVQSVTQFDNKFYKEYEHIIIISTELNFKELHIQGELIILSKNKSSQYLKNSLAAFLDELDG